MNISEVEDIEMDLLLDALCRRYGYDFRQYTRASVKRRMRHHLEKTELKSFSHLIPRVLHNEEAFRSLLFDLSVTVTEMFRDPPVYTALREGVLPYLKTFPFIRVWHAGCATGEEVYSLAILLKEESLYDRTRIYATDINDQSLEQARSRIYPLNRIREYSANYQKAGGRKSFSDYYFARYQSAILDASLAENVTFANHNLVTDGVFGEMHMILCRNVLIYFNRELQNRVLSIFRDSLCHNGFLCLGTKETVAFSDAGETFAAFRPAERIFQYRKRDREAVKKGG